MFFYSFISFWLCWVFIVECRFSLVEIRGYSLVHRLLIALASLVVAHGLQSTGSIAVVHKLSCSTACGSFPDQRLNPCLLHWQADSTTEPPGEDPSLILKLVVTKWQREGERD